MMNRRPINPNFFNNEKPKSVVSFKTKCRAARADGRLNLSCCQLTDLPVEIFELENHIEEGEKFWESVPLASLDVSGNKLVCVPPNVGQLLDLSVLKLKDNLLETLPDALYEGCQNLKTLDVDSNRLQTVGESICRLPALKDLMLSNNALQSMPHSLFQMRSLRHLDLQGNQLQSLPDIPWAWEGLVYLNLSSNRLQRLPVSVGAMRSLEALHCHSNSLSVLPDLTQLSLLKILNVSQNSLSRFPVLPRPAKGGRVAAGLVELHLGYNRIGSIDMEGLLAHSATLCDLFIHNNQLGDLPAEVELLTALKTLDVSNNSLKEIPASLGWMPGLQRMKVDGNQLKTIRQLLLTKPTNEFKAYLRTRGPSMVAPATGTAASTAYDDGRGASMEERVQQRLRDITAGVLDLSGLGMVSLPSSLLDELVRLPAINTLHTVVLNNNQFIRIPYEVEQLNMIQNLQMQGNRLGENRDRSMAEDECRYLESVTSLDVGKNRLSMGQLHSQLMKVNPDRLVELIADNNPLVDIHVGGFPHLRVLRLSFCGLTTILGIDFRQLPSLTSVDLSNNKLEELGRELLSSSSSSTHRLEYLNLENNCLQEIPPVLAALPQLRVLLIMGNPQRGIRTHVIQQGSEAVLAALRKKLQDDTGEWAEQRSRPVPAQPTGGAAARATVFKSTQQDWCDSSAAVDRVDRTKAAYSSGGAVVQSRAKPLGSYVNQEESATPIVRGSGSVPSRSQRAQVLQSTNAKRKPFVNDEWVN